MNTTMTATTAPVAQWVTVRDAAGRPHLEIRWSVLGASHAAPLHAAA